MKFSPLIILCFTFLMTATSCRENLEKSGENAINLGHLNHLYKEITLDNDIDAAIIHIYSEYPGYEYAIEPGEGFTCVDDVARTVVFLSGYLSDTDDPEIRSMITRLTEFILYMQADNGYFYNFMWNDLSVNRTYRTSLAQPDWWSWRALWALCRAYPFLEGSIAERTEVAVDKLVSNIKELNPGNSGDMIYFEKIMLPGWLPMGTAFDQGGLLMLGLQEYFMNIRRDKEVLTLISLSGEGLMMAQKGDSLHFPFGAYLSWNNLWHSYGNIQAYAMLKAGRLLGRKDFIASALTEIDNFYPYLIRKGYVDHFYLHNSDTGYYPAEMQQFPQIAYGIRPMVYACMEAYAITGEKKYFNMATEIASWLSGKNPAGIKMYDPETGRCFDGIVSENEVNRNSGAESTIEALLTLQKVENLEDL